MAFSFCEASTRRTEKERPSRTVPVARSAHSLHGYFIRPGDALQPITFTVETLRDGRSFSVRRVLASQNEKAILALTCSFQEPAGSALGAS